MTVVLAIVGALVAIWIVTCVLALWWIARRNRVVAGARTGAPLHWIAAPSRAAGAHRRLRRAVSAARAGLDAGPGDGTAHAELAACVASLERQAVDLDHRLVIAGRCPPATRWKLVGDLDPQIMEVERLGSRLAEIAVLAPGPTKDPGDGMEALDGRLAALAAARQELDALDAGVPAPPPVQALPSPGVDGLAVPGRTPVSEPARRRDV